jgi:hypothetical protein
MHMRRTSFMLPTDLKNRAEQRARRLGISLGEFIRRSILEALDRHGAGVVHDTLLTDDAVFSGEAPADASSRHDEYLYGRER